MWVGYTKKNPSELSSRHFNFENHTKIFILVSRKNMNFSHIITDYNFLNSYFRSLQHENLVCLKGIILDQASLKIVTEYMSKGSLLEYLRSRGRQFVTRKDQIKFAL